MALSRQQWPNNRGVQGLNNGKGQSMQEQMTAAQLTYAQKVKGRRLKNAQAAQQAALQQQQPSNTQPPQRQFRMVPTQAAIIAAQSMPAALQSYAYPYNYSNLQQQRRAPPSQQQPTQQSSSKQSSPPLLNNGKAPSPSIQQHSANPYRSRGRGPQRDFFDRKVQSNVNSAVSQYYNYPPSQQQMGPRYPPNNAQQQRQMTMQAQQQREMHRQQRVQQYQQQQQQYRQPLFNRHRQPQPQPPMNNNSYRGGGGRGRGRGGSSFGQRPSYRDNNNSNAQRNMRQMQSNANIGSGQVKNAKRGKPSDLQLDRYQNAADRDVLCWIFENQGKCRYGERCQWLHLDRETGQYVPTVYIMNSLSDKERETICKEVVDKKKEKTEKEAKEDEEKADEVIESTNETPKDPKDEAKEEEKVQEVDPIVLQEKFMRLMQEGIKKREEQLKQREIDAEEENKMQKDDKDSTVVSKGKEEQSEEDNKESEATSDGMPKICTTDSKYGKYGTTFDRQNVCWEFNTFVGCRKGAKCKWTHAYLVKESAHPYTGEKLNGMAVRKFRVSNNI